MGATGNIPDPMTLLQQQGQTQGDTLSNVLNSGRNGQAVLAPPSHPIKKMLSNFFSGMGDAMTHYAGLPTDYEKQQMEIANQLRQRQQASTEQFHQDQLDIKQHLADLQQQQALGPILSAEQALAMGMPELAGQHLFKGLSDYLGKTKSAEMRGDSAVDVATIKANAPKPSRVDPIIAAQVGQPPDPSKYAGGESNPAYQAAAKDWGSRAEAVKNRMASAGRIAGNMSRVDTFVGPDGQLRTMTAADAINQNAVKSAPAFQSMGKDAQFQEMKTGSTSFRHAIEGLDKDFTSSQMAKMTLAAKAPDESVLRTLTDSLLGDQSLTPAQQDFVIAQAQMHERLLSLRTVAGMGQGAMDTRAAIQSTLPSVKTGSKQYALKKLDAVDQQIDSLYRGVPRMPGAKMPAGNGASLDSNTAQIFLKAAGGDKARARQLATQNGWKIQ